MLELLLWDDGGNEWVGDLTRLCCAVTTARCPHCEFTKAYFMQIQIRSADEPSTTFYKCVQCKKQWNDK